MEKQNKKQHAAPVRCFVHTAAVTYRCVFHAGAVLAGDQWGVQFKRAPMKTHDTCSMRDNAVTSHNKLSDYLWNYHGTSSLLFVVNRFGCVRVARNYCARNSRFLLFVIVPLDSAQQ